MSLGDNQPLFELLSSLLNEVESLSNQEEVDLRAKIEALKSEVSKVPSQPVQHTDDTELDLARKMDELSSKLDAVDKMISSTDPDVKSLLSSTADVWMPVITATTEERRKFSSSAEGAKPQAEQSKSG